MRHNKKINHLGRKTAHRKAMLANMASSLLMHKRISTTLAKAKALRMYVEPLITRGKSDTTHSRRVVFSYLQDKDAVSELFREIATKIADRPGGYTRILKTGNRLGDNAEMCIMELVDYNEAMLAAKDDAAKSKKRRSRRAGAKKDEVVAAAPAKAKTEAKAKPVAKEEVKVVEDAEVVEEEVKVVEDAEVVEEVAETPVAETEVATEATSEPAEEKADESAEEKKEE